MLNKLIAKLNISEKDRKMLLVLAVFVAAVGYYMFIIEPLSDLSATSEKQLQKVRKDLLVFKTRLSGLANYETEFRSVREMVAIAYGNIMMPFVDVPLDTKIEIKKNQ